MIVINWGNNAQEENIISNVIKNKISFRPGLEPKGILPRILTIKLTSTELAFTLSHQKVLPKEKIQQA